MNCPACNLVKQPLQDACNACGYRFVGPQKDSLPVLVSIERSVRVIKNILIFWLILSLLSALGSVFWVLSRL